VNRALFAVDRFCIEFAPRGDFRGDGSARDREQLFGSQNGGVATDKKIGSIGHGFRLQSFVKLNGYFAPHHAAL
jgi:hypothetical protein